MITPEAKKRMEAGADAADRMDYSSCSDSTVYRVYCKAYQSGMSDPEANKELLLECEKIMIKIDVGYQSVKFSTHEGLVELFDEVADVVKPLLEKLRAMGKTND